MTRTVVLDIDGVLADFNGPFAREICKGSDVDPATITFNKWYWHDDYLPKAAVHATWERLKTQPGHFWTSLKLLPGGQALINDCLNLGLDVHFATARPKETYADTYDWLQQFIRLPKLCMTEQKGLYCACVDAEFFLDDKPENCLNVLRTRGTMTTPTLLDAPWNQSFSHLYIPRVATLGEFSRTLQAAYGR